MGEKLNSTGSKKEKFEVDNCVSFFDCPPKPKKNNCPETSSFYIDAEKSGSVRYQEKYAVADPLNVIWKPRNPFVCNPIAPDWRCPDDGVPRFPVPPYAPPRSPLEPGEIVPLTEKV